MKNLFLIPCLLFVQMFFITKKEVFGHDRDFKSDFRNKKQFLELRGSPNNEIDILVEDDAFSATESNLTSNTHFNKWHFVLDYNSTVTPANGYKIKTNLPFQNGQQMPTILIQGYMYGNANPIDLKLVWYIYNDEFISYKASSSGSHAPQIRLSNEGGKVVIFLVGGVYYARFNIQAYENMGTTDSQFEGWTVVDEAVSGSKTVTVPYEQNFPGTTYFTGGVWNSTGNVGIGISNPNAKLHIYNNIDGVFNGIVIDNKKNYGVGTGINETSRLVLSLSEGGDPLGRIFGYLEAGTNSETSSTDGWMAFGTRTGGNAIEKMRLTSAGNLVIGATTDNGIDKLQVNGSIKSNSITTNIAQIIGGHPLSSSNYELELFSPVESPLGELSIRFHHGNKWWNQIRANQNGFRFTTGHDGTLVPIEAESITANSFIKTDGSVIWHSGNDGTDSGLDADLLDGKNASELNYHVPNVTDIYAIGGQNLYTFFNSSNLPANAPVSGSDWVQGIQFPLAGNPNYRQIIASSNNDLYFGSQGNGVWQPWRKIFDSGNDGSGSGMDADLLDGKEGEYFGSFNTNTLGNNIDFDKISYNRNNLLVSQPVHLPNYTGQTNAPFNGYGQILTFGSDGGYFPFQLAVQQNDGAKIKWRMKYSPNQNFDFSGTPWLELYHSGNMSSILTWTSQNQKGKTLNFTGWNY